MRSTKIALLAVSLLLFLPSSGQTEVNNSERLRLTRQATGQTSGSSSSFQNRVDAILERNPDPERAHVISSSGGSQGDSLLSVGTDSSIFLNTEPSPAPVEKEEEELAKPGEEGPQLKSKVDASDEAYQKDLDKLYEEEEKKREEAQTEKPKEEAPAPKSKLKPSLANNPFYFDPERHADFEENKVVILSRLMQIGFTRDEAADILQYAGGPEDVVLTLMQEHGYEYGDAASIVRIEEEEPEE